MAIIESWDYREREWPENPQHGMKHMPCEAHDLNPYDTQHVRGAPSRVPSSIIAGTAPHDVRLSMQGELCV